MHIEIRKSFQQDQCLKNEMTHIALASYVDPKALLEREYINNDTIFLLRNEEGELAAFFMNGIHTIHDEKINYLGLACVSERYKNSGFIIHLFLKYFEYLLENRVTKNIWLTTPSEQIYKVISIFANNVNPRLDFSFSHSASILAEKIIRHKSFTSHEDNPFILKGAADPTKYSNEECIRQSVKKASPFAIQLNHYQFNEQRGDRIMVLCQLPNIEKFTEINRRFKRNSDHQKETALQD